MIVIGGFEMDEARIDTTSIIKLYKWAQFIYETKNLYSKYM